jgi:hypothetical protein
MDLQFIRESSICAAKSSGSAKRSRIFRGQGIPTKSADELRVRMQTKVDELCAGRDRQVGEQRRKYPGTNKVINRPIERRFR